MSESNPRPPGSKRGAPSLSNLRDGHTSSATASTEVSDTHELAPTTNNDTILPAGLRFDTQLVRDLSG